MTGVVKSGYCAISTGNAGADNGLDHTPKVTE